MSQAPFPLRPFLEHKGPLRFAHRGGSLINPENTFAAFDHAIEIGCDVLETDVHLTRDGSVVVCHDDRVDRTTNCEGPIKKHTLAEIRAMDAGFRFTTDDGLSFPERGKGHLIPTLTELLTRYPDVRLNIDLKGRSRALVGEAWSILQREKALDRVMIASTRLRTLRRFRKLSQNRVPTSACGPEVLLFMAAACLGQASRLSFSFEALQVPIKLFGIKVLTARFYAAARQIDMPIHVWTIDSEADMRQLLRDGVRGLMSDHPARLVSVTDAFSAQPADGC